MVDLNTQSVVSAMTELGLFYLFFWFSLLFISRTAADKSKDIVLRYYFQLKSTIRIGLDLNV